MAIGSAIQKGKQVHVYDDKGRLIFSRTVGSGPHDGLVGYTGSTVSIRRGNQVVTFNDKGQQRFSRSVT